MPRPIRARSPCLQGPGTTSHLTAELFSELTGAKMVHVPYRGTGPALNDLVAGHVDFFFIELATAYKLHDGGRARILAVATERRLDVLPDIPTVSEAGSPQVHFRYLERHQRAAQDASRDRLQAQPGRQRGARQPEIKARFQQQHLLPGGGSPADMAKLKKEETERWTKVIHDAGIKQQSARIVMAGACPAHQRLDER